MSNSEKFINELMDIGKLEKPKIAVLNLLMKWQGYSIYIPRESKSDRRIRAAIGMLTNGMNKSEISSALIKRFGITSRQSYTDIKRAEISRNTSSN